MSAVFHRLMLALLLASAAVSSANDGVLLYVSDADEDIGFQLDTSKDEYRGADVVLNIQKCTSRIARCIVVGTTVIAVPIEFVANQHFETRNTEFKVFHQQEISEFESPKDVWRIHATNAQSGEEYQYWFNTHRGMVAIEFIGENDSDSIRYVLRGRCGLFAVKDCGSEDCRKSDGR